MGKRYPKEFRDAPDLERFDRSDRKFVAVALTCDGDAIIANAVDSDWSESNTALEAAGVHVRELCPQCVKAS